MNFVASATPGMGLAMGSRRNGTLGGFRLPCGPVRLSRGWRSRGDGRSLFIRLFISCSGGHAGRSEKANGKRDCPSTFKVYCHRFTAKEK